MSAWLAEALVGSTLAMLVVLALRRPVASAFGARWAYALWALPALRLILPPLPALLPKAPLPPVVIVIPTTAQLTAPQPAASPMIWEWIPFVMALWAGGAVIFLTLQWLDYRGFAQRLAARARPARPPCYEGIAILVSPDVEGPIALGLARRKIVLPADFLRRYTAVEQRLAIEHELIHHRRGDLWWNLAALVMLSLNWFNPIAWLAFAAFRSDQELACDEAVAARATPGERGDYATALVKAATRPGLIATCPLTRAGQLKRRLKMMRFHRISRLRSAGGGAAIAALAAGGFALGTPGFSHAPDRQIVYRLAESGPAAPRVASAAWPQPASRPHAVHRARAAAKPAARSKPILAEPLALADVLPPDSPSVDLAPIAARAVVQRRVLRIATPVASASAPSLASAAPHWRVYSASLDTADEDGDDEVQLQHKLEMVSWILSQLEAGDQDQDVLALRTALERARGHLKIKIQKVTREDGA